MINYLKSLAWWKYTALLPFPFIFWYIFKGIYGANFYMQVQYEKSEGVWSTDYVNIPSFIMQPTSSSVERVMSNDMTNMSLADLAVSPAILGAIALVIYTVLFTYLNRNMIMFTGWLVPFVLFGAMIIGSIYLFIKIQYTAVVFSIISGTTTNALLWPFHLVDSAYLASQSFMQVIVGVIFTVLFAVSIMRIFSINIPLGRTPEQVQSDIDFSNRVRDSQNIREIEYQVRKMNKKKK